MTVLVPGGAGYIGSQVVLALLAAGEKVVVLDNLSTGRLENVPPGVTFVRESVANHYHLRRVMEEHAVDAILHFAGSIKVDESVRCPLRYYRNNVSNSCALLDAAVKHGVKHFIFSSSAAVYGTPLQTPVPERAPRQPTSPYGHSKLMVEQMLQDVAAAYPNFRYVALRYFNVVGVDPECRVGYKLEPQPSHLVKAALAAAQGRSKKFVINGADYATADGTAVRDLLHVSDLAEAHVRSLGHLRMDRTSQILNCGYGHGYSVREVVEAVRRVTGADFAVELGPRRPGDVAEVVADISYLKEVLPWEPKFDNLDTIVRHQLAWERSQTGPVAY